MPSVITLIFDIDGTLVDSAKFDAELYCEAVKAVVGNVFIHADWGRYEHVTDPGILKQILRENDVQIAENLISSVRAYFGKLVASYLQDNRCPAMRGALHEVARLRSDEGFSLGFATGGWGNTASMKLRSAGFNMEDIPLFSGDHHHERVEILKSCQRHLAQCDHNVVYVGDGPWDVQAAQKLNWGFVGVGEQIRSQSPVWVPDFASKAWRTAPGNALRRDEEKR